jgi:hypothetical protein
VRVAIWVYALDRCMDSQSFSSADRLLALEYFKDRELMRLLDRLLGQFDGDRGIPSDKYSLRESDSSNTPSSAS